MQTDEAKGIIKLLDDKVSKGGRSITYNGYLSDKTVLALFMRKITIQHLTHGLGVSIYYEQTK